MFIREIILMTNFSRVSNKLYTKLFQRKTILLKNTF